MVISKNKIKTIKQNLHNSGGLIHQNNMIKETVTLRPNANRITCESNAKALNYRYLV